MPSFDVVSQPDLQEIRNAVDQAAREVATRFDLKDAGAEIEFVEEKNVPQGIRIVSKNEYTTESVTDVVIGKLVKRSVDPRFFEREPVETAGGGRGRRLLRLRQGIEQALAKDIVKLIKDEKLKVQAQIRGDELRVTGKSRDDLQAVIRLLKGKNFDQPLNFVNMRD